MTGLPLAIFFPEEIGAEGLSDLPKTHSDWPESEFEATLQP